MKILRKTLFPFSILYDAVTKIRNLLYDKQIFKSASFDLPIIAVGNLSTGGTGKSPQIEYLIRLLSKKYKVAILSRGYKRTSTGFVLATQSTDVKSLGDEPYQFFCKFKDILVAVDSDRKNAIEQLLSLNNKPDIILLDDAFQHRKVKAGFYILLTAYNDLFSDDCLLPAGNLRESKTGVNRANVIVVTKCPANLSTENQNKIKRLLLRQNHKNIPILFTTITYDEHIYNENQTLKVSEVKNQSKILLAGIAKPKPFFDFLESANDKILVYPDHHNFSIKEILEIQSIAKNKIIITTEKDFVRLKKSVLADQLYYLPIKTSFLSNQNIDQLILYFVENF